MVRDDAKDALGRGENLVPLSPIGSGWELGCQKAAQWKCLPGCWLLACGHEVRKKQNKGGQSQTLRHSPLRDKGESRELCRHWPLGEGGRKCGPRYKLALLWSACLYARCRCLKQEASSALARHTPEQAAPFPFVFIYWGCLCCRVHCGGQRTMCGNESPPSTVRVLLGI